MISGDVLVGTVVDNRYRLTKKIGKGSFGWVFEVTEEMAGQYVGRAAVKLLAPEDEAQREMVLREIRALAGLTHEFIIAYRTSGQISDGALANTIFLVTELGEESLAQVIQSPQRLPEPEVWAMGRGLASALAYIHAKGSVHRDVKPENILRVDGRWKMGDFGLARAVEGAQMSASGAKGTLRYMAPEVLHNEITAASDVYALGVTLLRCLTGKYAHEGTTEGEFMANLVTKAPELPSELPDVWRVVLAGCLERDPRLRWSAGYLARQFEGGPAALLVPEDTTRDAEKSVTTGGFSGPAAPSTLPPVLGEAALQDRTIRIQDQGTEKAQSLSAAPARLAGTTHAAGTESQLTTTSASESVRSMLEPPVELRLEKNQDVPEAYAPEAIDTIFDGAVRKHREHQTRSRLSKIVVLLALLAIGAGAYAWHLGTLSDLLQRVRSEALDGLIPPTETPRVVELTVLADGPVKLRREPRLDAPSLGMLTRDATVRTIGKSGEWYKIQMPTGGVAWIHQSAFLGGNSQPAVPERLMRLMEPGATQASEPEEADPLSDVRDTGQAEQLSPKAPESLSVPERIPGASGRFRRSADDGRADRVEARRARVLRLKERCQRQPDLPVCRRFRRLSQ